MENAKRSVHFLYSHNLVSHFLFHDCKNPEYITSVMFTKILLHWLIFT